MADADLNPLELAGLRFQIAVFEEALQATPEDTEALRFLSHAYSGVGRLEDGLQADRKLVELLPVDPRVRYNLACSCALTGRIDEAIDELEKACEFGFDDINLMRKDKDLDGLREHPRYQAIERSLRRRLEEK